MRRVQRATLARLEAELTERVTIRCLRRGPDLPECAIEASGQDIGRAHDVAMRLKPTVWTPLGAPLRFVAVPAVRARLRRMVFVHQDDLEACGLSFVGES